LIGETTAPCAFERDVCAGSIVNTVCLTVGVSEIKFGQIPFQVFGAYMLIGAVNAALQDAKEAFNGIGVDGPAHIFACAVLHNFVAGELLANDAGGQGVVSAEMGDLTWLETDTAIPATNADAS
jgi:hypothetical protein